MATFAPRSIAEGPICWLFVVFPGPSSFKVDVLPAHPVTPRSAIVIPPLSDIKHRTQLLPAIPLARIRDPENAVYLAGLKPYKLVNFTSENRELFAARWAFDYFSHTFPDSVVDFYPYNMPVRNVGPHFVPLSEALREVTDPSGKYRTDLKFPGSYALWNLDTAAWEKVWAV